ncbi:MAG: GIY-YIG nuclease family protein [Desulfosarcinaceae bacterium]|jgi:Uri superfamily endonuclease
MFDQKWHRESRELPRHKGSYLLLLELAEAQPFTVGRLGCLAFGPGFYLYAGSARGPGGLAARLHHHLKMAGRCHWHIDYLRLKAPVVAVWAVWGAADRCLSECQLVARLHRRPPLFAPFRGFGSSDCTCYSHLLHWPLPASQSPSWATFRQLALLRLDNVLDPLTRLIWAA